MTVASSPIDAAPVRDVLRQEGYEPLEGANSDYVEVWIGPAQETICLPYFRKGDRSQFLEQGLLDAFEKGLL